MPFFSRLLHLRKERGRKLNKQHHKINSTKLFFSSFSFLLRFYLRDENCSLIEFCFPICHSDLIDEHWRLAAIWFESSPWFMPWWRRNITSLVCMRLHKQPITQSALWYASTLLHFKRDDFTMSAPMVVAVLMFWATVVVHLIA